jgi:hypothetical protein
MKTQAPPVRSPKTFYFGPDDCLQGAITDPTHGRATIGAIIHGMGVAELRTARKLAKLGIVTLQMQIHQEPDDWVTLLNAEGVRYCKEAIKLLHEQRGVDSFICMGNCGRGSISFRVALDDPRVVGLILTNPHISPALTIRESYAQRFLSRESWRRLLGGTANLTYHLPNIRLLVLSLLGRVLGVTERKLIDQSGHNKDLTMPDRFDQRVAGLARRGVKVLMAFAENDEGLSYFRRLYGQSFGRLTSGLSIKLLATTTHIPSHDDAAAGALARMVDEWAREAGFAKAAPRVGGPRPPTAHARETQPAVSSTHAA